MADITCKELKERIDAGEELNIVDVREQNEFDEYNIGAKLLPMSEALHNSSTAKPLYHFTNILN